MKSRFALTMMVIGLALVLVMSPGCKRGKQKPIDTGMAQAAGPESTSSNGLPGLNQDAITWTKATELQTVYFDFDSSALTPAAREILKANADKMKQNATALFQVEGHCDERGTQEYNLALGERRALAVRQYLVDLGVSGDRVVTISYGEEMPAVNGQGEDAWKMNRRAEFNRAVQ